jgi:hypothetical protein
VAEETDVRDVQLTMAAAARALATQGMVIFPCDAKTKQPLVQGGFKTATKEPAEIDGWWSQWPTAMIGMPTGEVNGLFALDVDCDSSIALNGFRALESWKGSTAHYRQHELSAHRVAASTGFPVARFKVKNTASRLGKGIDVRGDGGYIIVAPSINACGLAYA